MNVIRQRLHAGGKLFGIRDHSVFIVAAALPSIINEQIIVAGIAQPCGTIRSTVFLIFYSVISKPKLFHVI